MANELSALVDYAGASVDHLFVSPTQSLHEAVASRVFRTVGPISRPVRLVHDTIAGATYTAIRGATARTAAFAAASLERATGDDLRLISGSRRGRTAISALNALAGDLLEERGNSLALPMTVRERGVDVLCDRDSLRRAYRRPTGRLAVFVHGLGETEEDWWRRQRSHRLSFGARLKRGLGFTPVYVRYNSGLHVSDNGSRLSDLMEELLQEWPVPVVEVAIIGHSMGGLVARSAGHLGRKRNQRWVSNLHHLVTLGSPHAGVPLEKLVHVASWVLRGIPESRWLAEILDRRSAGIRDLRFGYLVEEEWREENPRQLLHNRRTSIPPLPGCTHTFMTATMARSPRHPLSWIGGDLLVRTESASGRGSRGAVVASADAVIHLPGLTHFDLLDDALVYRHIRTAIAARAVEPEHRRDKQ